MKTNLFVYISIHILFILQGCSDDNNSSISTCFSLISKNVINGTLLFGGSYQILNSNNEILSVYNLSSGTINIRDLPVGEYFIEEVKAPEGYISEQKKIELTLTDSNCREIFFLYTTDSNVALPSLLNLKFYDSQGNKFLADYEATRIGEYYWVNRNFYHKIEAGNGFENDVPITQALLNRYVERVFIDPKYFQLSDINDFEKYYGRYYSYPSIDYMNDYCYMANEQGNKIDGWKLPSPDDYRQLFAMCPFNTTYDRPHTNLNERDVRFALSAKEGNNPLAFDINQGVNNPYKVYWFSPQYVKNIYGFNLMPGGARLNGDWLWCNGLGPDNGCYNDGKKGDIYHLFYTAYLAVQNSNGSFGAAIIYDYIATKEFETYHYLNVRWCRPLSDLELGYKLYINTEKTDIKRLDINDPKPDGYTELPRGYIRGFYVQYILDKPNSEITVRDIIKYTNSVEDNFSG